MATAIAVVCEHLRLQQQMQQLVSCYVNADKSSW